LNEIFNEKLDSSTKYINIQYNITNFIDEIVNEKVNESLNLFEKKNDINNKSFQNDINNQIRDINNNINNVARSINSSSNEINLAEIIEIKNEVNSLTNNYNKINDSYVDLVKKVKLVEENIINQLKENNLNERDKNLNIRIENLESNKCNEQIEEIREISRDFKLQLEKQSKDSEIKNIIINQKLKELKVDVDVITANLKDKTLIESQTTKLNINEFSIVDLENNVRKLQDEFKNYDILHQNNKDQLNKEKEDIISKLVSINKQYNDSNDKIINLEKKFEHANDKFNSINSIFYKNNVKILSSLKNSFELFFNQSYDNFYNSIEKVINKLYNGLSGNIISLNTNFINYIRRTEKIYFNFTTHNKLQLDKNNKQTTSISDISKEINSLLKSNEISKTEITKIIDSLNEKIVKQEENQNIKIEVIEKSLIKNSESLKLLEKNLNIKTINNENTNNPNNCINPNNSSNSYKRRNTELLNKKEESLIFEDANNKLIKVS